MAPPWMSWACHPGILIEVARFRTRRQSAPARTAEIPTNPGMQRVEPGRPAMHLINRDIPTHDELNDQLDHQSQQLPLQY